MPILRKKLHYSFVWDKYTLSTPDPVFQFDQEPDFANMMEEQIHRIVRQNKDDTPDLAKKPLKKVLSRSSGKQSGEELKSQAQAEGKELKASLLSNSKDISKSQVKGNKLTPFVKNHITKSPQPSNVSIGDMPDLSGVSRIGRDQ